jgi:demethylmenaquinone methyltransferase/2-methoxy-6-polyprenyl-1,4-benzoquinol methylase
VLELAAGTGNFTRSLAGTAAHLTAVDASAETLEIAKAKVAAVARACPVDFVVADVFEWRPSRRYDAVCFAFWLSHVPADRFEEFWQLVADCLGPDGRVFFVDNAAGTSTDPRDDGLAQRTLNDGSAYTIVKRYWEPEALASDLGELGWAADVTTTAGNLFLLGSAVRD